MEQYRFKQERIDKIIISAENVNDYHQFSVKTDYGTDDITVTL